MDSVAVWDERGRLRRAGRRVGGAPVVAPAAGARTGLQPGADGRDARHEEVIEGRSRLVAAAGPRRQLRQPGGQRRPRVGAQTAGAGEDTARLTLKEAAHAGGHLRPRDAAHRLGDRLGEPVPAQQLGERLAEPLPGRLGRLGAGRLRPPVLVSGLRRGREVGPVALSAGGGGTRPLVRTGRRVNTTGGPKQTTTIQS